MLASDSDVEMRRVHRRHLGRCCAVVKCSGGHESGGASRSARDEAALYSHSSTSTGNKQHSSAHENCTHDALAWLDIGLRWACAVGAPLFRPRPSHSAVPSLARWSTRWGTSRPLVLLSFRRACSVANDCVSWHCVHVCDGRRASCVVTCAVCLGRASAVRSVLSCFLASFVSSPLGGTVAVLHWPRSAQ